MSAEVLEAQKWLNSTYGGRAGYQRVEETGLPGSATSAALVSALQIELGMSTVTGVFGEQTEAACDANRISIGDSGNQVKIIQYGLFSKGYNPGEVTGIYNGTTGLAVQSIIADAGVSVLADASIGSMAMKAILGVDEYKLLAGGDPKVRSIQQDLNSRYRSYSGLCACDGYYGRSTNTALIYAIQAEEGMPTDMATGFFGPSTKTYLPDLWQPGQWGMNGNYTDAQIANFTRLAQYALYCVGVDRYTGGSGSKYDPGAMNGSQSASTLSALHAFQSDYALAQRDMVGLDEWMGLLVSTGNPNRDGLACDCATQLVTPDLVAALYNDEYRIVGRYLTGTVGGGANKRPKNLTSSEIQTIFAGGMSLFCIFQDDADWWQDHDDLSGYFGYSRGFSDAQKAVNAAYSLGVPRGEYIYFAVDYDFMEGEVWSKVVPHFQGVNAYMAAVGSPYRIGIYSARNTCGIVSAQGLASSSFVSDMSTGYSGNLGYPLPSNWAFDQIQEYTNSAGFGIDKNVTSGRYMGFSSVTEGQVPPGACYLVDLDYYSTLKESTSTMRDILWSDDWLGRSSADYGSGLATAAMALSALAYSDSGLVSAGLQKIGFPSGSIFSGSVAGEGPVGYHFASKRVTVGSSTANFAVAIIRGTSNRAEWESNMDMSGGSATASEHRGFRLATDGVYEAFISWMKDQGINSASTKILVTGHSRGAAVANMLAKRLMASGFVSNNIFAYAFATPNVSTSVSALPNIHNVVNPEDFVPKAPLEKWGFGKHGVVHELPSLSNTEMSSYDQLHSLMNDHFKKLVGEDHLNYTGAAETSEFIANVGNYAPTVQAYIMRRGTELAN